MSQYDPNDPNGDLQNEELPPQPQNRDPVKNDWGGRSISPSAVVGIVAFAAVLGVVMFGMALCSRPSMGPVSGAAGDAYSPLERNVRAAFDNVDAGDQGQSANENGGSGGSGNGGNGNMNGGSNGANNNGASSSSAGGQPETAQERQDRAMDEQQQSMDRQEDMLDRQREQVPSILPENPPTPVPLGGDNY